MPLVRQIPEIQEIGYKPKWCGRCELHVSRPCPTKAEENGCGYMAGARIEEKEKELLRLHPERLSHQQRNQI
jgi:hypothetical protein